jgi:hypothetical protein
MSAVPDVSTGELSERSRLHVHHLVFAFLLSALPAAAAMAFGPSALEESNQTFISLYVATLPWSLALCAVTAGLAGGWFGPDERKQVLAAAGILLVFAVVGRAIAPAAPVDVHFQGGSPVVVASEVIVFGVIGYALVYGWPMWIASFFVAGYVGWLVREKRLPEHVDEVASEPPPVLTARVIQTSPARPAGVPLMAEPPTLPPPVMTESPARPQPEELGGLTKAELYQRARKLDIKGRSSMTKAELLAALRASQ